MLAAVRVVPTVAAAAVAGLLLPRPRNSVEAGSWVSSQHPSRSASPVRPPASPDAAALDGAETLDLQQSGRRSRTSKAGRSGRRSAEAGSWPEPSWVSRCRR